MTSYVVGLIGGVGVGKSTVLDIFHSFGVNTLSADKIARELVEPSMPALSAITTHFGENILNQDNTLNRAALRKIIFESPEEKHWLETLLHPEIRLTLEKRITNSHAPYCMVEIPLLKTITDYPYINRVLLVKANQLKKIQRVSQRDNASPDSVKDIIESQMKDAEREMLADDILHNNEDISSLKKTCLPLHASYLKHSTES